MAANTSHGRRSIHLILLLIAAIILQIVLLGMSAYVISQKPWEVQVCNAYSSYYSDSSGCASYGTYSEPSQGVPFFLILPFSIIGIIGDAICLPLIGIMHKIRPGALVAPIHGTQLFFFLVALVLGLIPADAVGGYFYYSFKEIHDVNNPDSDYYYYSNYGSFSIPTITKVLVAIFVFLILMMILDIWLLAGTCCCFGARTRRSQRQETKSAARQAVHQSSFGHQMHQPMSYNPSYQQPVPQYNQYASGPTLMPPNQQYAPQPQYAAAPKALDPSHNSQGYNSQSVSTITPPLANGMTGQPHAYDHSPEVVAPRSPDLPEHYPTPQFPATQQQYAQPHQALGTEHAAMPGQHGGMVGEQQALASQDSVYRTSPPPTHVQPATRGVHVVNP